MKCFYVLNGDVAISNNDIALATGIELERQVITAVLGTNKGEWFLNENEGINFRTMLTKNPDYDLIKAEIISGLNQINSDYSLTSFTHELNSDRNLILTITISKSSGEAIPLTLDTGGREYVSFTDNIERLTELLNVLVGEVIDNELFDLSYADRVLTVTLNLNPDDEEIEKVKFIIDSIVPDYITVVYVIEEPPITSRITSTWNLTNTNPVRIEQLEATGHTGTIDWGDGTVEDYDSSVSITHIYAEVGTYNISIDCEITNLKNYAFSDKSVITSITLPDSLKIINAYAFFKCTGLTEIIIPEGVISIYSDAFLLCTSLTSVTIPNSMGTLGTAFNNCTNLMTIIVHKSEGTLSGSPWGATNAEVIWTG